ncbi:hypothetical protein [Leifsonia sp. NCR5]|uniref:hypothetical protein n=1 Tax=Leifsonia sp. NCR5 TaxID=1978342 RepID=UPI000A18F69E|nr:hypothetical protein [Leifsonia sp. NCR5]
MSARLGFLLVRDGALILGDPIDQGTHLRFSDLGIIVRQPAEADVGVVPWESVHSITIAPVVANFRPPAWLMFTAAAATASIGLDWQPPVSDVPVRLELTTAGRPQSRELVCTGFVTRGYRRSQCESIQAALRLLVRDTAARRQILAHPERVLTLVR